MRILKIIPLTQYLPPPQVSLLTHLILLLPFIENSWKDLLLKLWLANSISITKELRKNRLSDPTLDVLNQKLHFSRTAKTYKDINIWEALTCSANF